SRTGRIGRERSCSGSCSFALVVRSERAFSAIFLLECVVLKSLDDVEQHKDAVTAGNPSRTGWIVPPQAEVCIARKDYRAVQSNLAPLASGWVLDAITGQAAVLVRATGKRGSHQPALPGGPQPIGVEKRLTRRRSEHVFGGIAFEYEF